MRSVMIAVLAVAAIAAAGAAGANEELAKKSGCMVCHAADNKLVGPAFKDIAAKYRSQKDAEAKLIENVKKGARGVWGEMPMPPNAQVKDEDIKTLVQWVLSLK